MHSHKSCLGCQHENLKFCGCCQIPYCVGCGKEWCERTYWFTYPYYNDSRLQYGQSTLLQPNTIPAGENINTLNDGHEVTASSCKHGA